MKVGRSGGGRRALGKVSALVKLEIGIAGMAKLRRTNDAISLADINALGITMRGV